MMRVKYEDGAIVSVVGSGLLYATEDIDHLSIRAARRLVDIHNGDPAIDYEGAEAILIKEGLYDESDK